MTRALRLSPDCRSGSAPLGILTVPQERGEVGFRVKRSPEPRAAGRALGTRAWGLCGATGADGTYRRAGRLHPRAGRVRIPFNSRFFRRSRRAGQWDVGAMASRFCIRGATGFFLRQATSSREERTSDGRTQRSFDRGCSGWREGNRQRAGQRRRRSCWKASWTSAAPTTCARLYVRALARGPKRLVLDLSGLSFMDSTGAGVTIDAGRRASLLGRGVADRAGLLQPYSASSRCWIWSNSCHSTPNAARHRGRRQSPVGLCPPLQGAARQAGG